MILDGTAADVIYTNGINGLPAMWLKASIRSVGMDPDNLATLAGRGTDHLPDGVKPWRDIWSAGQGIGLIHDLPSVAELVRDLQAEYLAACHIPDMCEAVTAALQEAAS
jgi:nitronate monooxygenase